MSRLLICAALALVLLGQTASAFVFNLQVRGHICFDEEMPHDYPVKGAFRVAPGYGQLIDLKVMDPANKVLYSAIGKDIGDFSFRTELQGEFAFCFYNRIVPGVKERPEMDRAVSFDLATGESDTKDYQVLAKVENLKPMELNLRVVQDLVRSIHSEYEYLMQKERELHDANEAMHSHSMTFSMLSIAILCLSGFWQTRHLKNYFKKKRMM